MKDSLQEAYLKLVENKFNSEDVENLDEAESTVKNIVDGFSKIEKELNKLHLQKQNIPFKSSDKLPPTMNDEKSKYFKLAQEFEQNLSNAEILASKIVSFIKNT